MNARGMLGISLLVAAAAGSWYLARLLDEPAPEEARSEAPAGGFYLKAAKILGSDEAGNMLYEIRADFAEQLPNREIEFENVRISYSPEATIPWVLDADSATIGRDQERVVLRGHVRAVSAQGIAGETTEIRTPYLEFEPASFRAETDSRVQIRIGSRSLTATGMLALLQENRVQLKSNVSGKFVP